MKVNAKMSCTKQSRFVELLETHVGILHKVSRLYQDQKEDQDDLFQDIILQLWQSFDTFRGDSEFSSWMYKVSINTAITYFKKKNRRPDRQVLPDTAILATESRSSVEQEDRMAILYSALHKLDKVEKALVFLYLEGQNSREIALALGISAVNVRVRLTRIKTKLKTILKSMGYGS
ncbi:MAG: sigma-70 family RNA polymerase sigma factor [Chitinophagaceae bacterium]|nr:sigma-70 family RNA polymerase sigma factor [Chitinophagaceae bacterium]